MSIDWTSVAVASSVTGFLSWYLMGRVNHILAELIEVQVNLERKTPTDVSGKFRALEHDLDMLRQSVLSGFIVKNPESDVAREELRTMHREAKALYTVSTEECLKVTERIDRFEDAHQSLIDRFQAVLRREDDDPIVLNHAAVAACKRLEVYANESFLDVRRQGIWLKQRMEEAEKAFYSRLTALNNDAQVTADDIESLQERLDKLEHGND